MRFADTFTHQRIEIAIGMPLVPPITNSYVAGHELETCAEILKYIPIV